MMIIVIILYIYIYININSQLVKRMASRMGLQLHSLLHPIPKRAGMSHSQTSTLPRYGGVTPEVIEGFHHLC